MATSCPPQYLALAGRLADESGRVIRSYFRAAVAVDDKEDQTPVTIADREAEAAMRALIEAECPDHGIIGEEHGASEAGAEFVWVLDPIDGTKSFITGKPIFGTLISLVRGGRPILGIIDQPIAGERWIGAAGEPTRFQGAPVTVRPCPALDDALLGTTSPDLFAGPDIAAFERLRPRVKHALYGGDCYNYGLLSAGFMDLVVEAGLKDFDYCALVPVVEGAGGIMTDWKGTALTLGSDGRVIAAGDRRSHEAALALLAQS